MDLFILGNVEPCQTTQDRGRPKALGVLLQNGILPPSDLIVRSFTQHSLGSSASHSSVKDLGSSLQSMVDVLIPLNLDEACVPRVPTVGMKTVAPFFDRTRNWRREMLPRNFGGADGRDSFARLPLERCAQSAIVPDCRCMPSMIS